ncbi:hypothetical protein HMPREF0908_1665 [Selenomonas flueggei ATCC 43531]|uniref:Uncharacterized protein n=1 Tax=Selenomonas flueggei ATCC 43531 TaxID=638302 RepID=C4V571_9FIRM|nr:hypothetical protein HMPREF0908_1665 [Selenomonas flueggei ATCC 43531]
MIFRLIEAAHRIQRAALWRIRRQKSGKRRVKGRGRMDPRFLIGIKENHSLQENRALARII